MGRYGKSRHGQARRKPSEPRYCNRADDCSTLVVVAILAPTPDGQERRWAAFEARDREPFSTGAVDCRVIVGDRQAWKPADLVEDYMVRHEITESAARELVSGFPWHRIHAHEHTEPEQQPEPAQPTTTRSTT